MINIIYLFQYNIDVACNQLRYLLAFNRLYGVIWFCVITKVLKTGEITVEQSKRVILEKTLNNKTLTKVKLFGEAAHLLTVVSGHVFKIWKWTKNFKRKTRYNACMQWVHFIGDVCSVTVFSFRQIKRYRLVDSTLWSTN